MAHSYFDLSLDDELAERHSYQTSCQNLWVYKLIYRLRLVRLVQAKSKTRWVHNVLLDSPGQASEVC